VPGAPGVPDQKPPKFSAPELETLVTFLDYLRGSLARKLEAVSEQDARRSLVPSGTSLLSLVQHLTAAEVLWFQIRFNGSTEPEPDEPLDDALPVERHLAHYFAAIARDNEIVTTSGSVDERCADPEFAELDLRWVLVHMIEETARHAGHADIIREQIDGATGR
jgi:uncharacterized damage-inducible protein DinB